MAKIFSGVRPTGRLHLGNYLGAIKNWLELQKKNDTIFAVVDYHGITTPFNPEEMQDNVYHVVLDYLAAGLDPEKSTLMVQSQVPEHTELAWILGALTPLSWLERVPTFKEKVAQHPKNVNLALLSYPVLMAADILIYKAEEVPVGEDQLPHIELANDIAKRFNKKFGETFPEVKPVLSTGSRVMSLKDPTKKMSKTGDEGIALSDSPAVVRKKIAKAVTDSGKDIVMKKDKPALTNLLTIYSLLSGKEIKEIEKEYKGKGYGDFKTGLAEVIIDFLTPFQDSLNTLEQDPAYVKKVLDEGAANARKIAQGTLLEVKKKIGLIP